MPELGSALASLTCFALALRQRHIEARSAAFDRAVWSRPDHVSTVRRPLASQLARIVACCPELRAPRYVPPIFAESNWANVALSLAKNRLVQWLGIMPTLKHEILAMPDGGTLSIDFCDDSTSRALPEEAPIVIVLHTTVGNGPSMVEFMQAASARGWRSCVLNRRAAAEPLTSPNFNLMGSVEDTRSQVEVIRQRYPNAYLGMIGLSAGSGLMVSYLGTLGSHSPVSAGCSLCPAYDISKAFEDLSEQFPFADSWILQTIKDKFLVGNAEVLENLDSDTFRRCLQE